MGTSSLQQPLGLNLVQRLLQVLMEPSPTMMGLIR